MDFGLKEIGVTFMIGAFTILGFELVLYYLFEMSVTGFYRDKLGLGTIKKRVSSRRSAAVSHDDLNQPMKIAVFVGLCFGIGIISEDLSYKYVDDAQTPLKATPAFVKQFLPEEMQNPPDLLSKYDSRVKILIKDLQNPKISPLARDLAQSGAFEIVDRVKGAQVQQWILSGGNDKPCEKIENICPEGCKICTDDIINSIGGLYYYSKNRVYRENNYYDELKKIQSRLEFSRSIAVISFVYIVFAIIAFPISLLFSHIKNKVKNRLYKYPSKFWLNKIRKALLTILTLVSIYFFSVWAYERESDEFNKRAFGYFSSTLIHEGFAKQKGNSEKTQFIVEGTIIPNNERNKSE